MMILKICSLIFTILAVALPAKGQDLVLPPPVDARVDPALNAFIDQLKTAVKSRDAKFIESNLAPEVMSSLGGDRTRTVFMEDWAVKQKTSPFWTYMERVLTLGGDWEQAGGVASGMYVFPYTYTVELDEETDYLNIGVITGKNVNLRSEPDLHAGVLTQLTYHVVNFETDDDGYRISRGKNDRGDPEWYKVSPLQGGPTGWVFWKYVSDLLGPRLFLSKNATGAWEIYAFVSGD